MPPKAKSSTDGKVIKKKGSSAMNQIDELMGQSEVVGDERSSQLTQAEHDKKLKDMKHKYQSFNSNVSMKRNEQAIA